MATFDEDYTAYVSFKEKALPFLVRKLTDDVVGLKGEQEYLEVMYTKALTHAAIGKEDYYAEKAIQIERWIMELGRSISAAVDAAKAYCSKQLWFREDSAGFVKAIESRKRSVGQRISYLENRVG